MRIRADHPVSLQNLGSIGSFTPATQDPRLVAAYSKAILSAGSRSFRFTPTSGSMSGRRSITVAVRAGADDSIGDAHGGTAGVSITPVAYNLGVSRGWKRFALPDSVGTRPIDPIPVDITPDKSLLDKGSGFSLEEKKPKFTASILLDSQRAVGTAPQTLAGEKVYSVDVASSYSLSRHINVMAGIRYRGPNTNRLSPLTDERQDSQAVYVGTQFKF